MIRNVIFAFLFASVPLPTYADAVSKALKGEIKDCVARNTDRLGSPLKSSEDWAHIVSLAATQSWHMVQLFGSEGHGDLQDALIARTQDTLISTLDERDFRGHRSTVLKTVDFCMPFALLAASDEMERQKSALCPDQTDYSEAVERLTVNDSELREQYGDAIKDVRSLSRLQIRLQLLDSFSSIFYYDQNGYKRLAYIDELDEILISISGKNLATQMQDVATLVDEALSVISGMERNTELIGQLRIDLICLKDWIDIYPFEEMAAASDVGNRKGKQ